MKKMMAGAAVAVSLVGLSATAAPAAMAIGDDQGITSVNGNGSSQAFGNSSTRGDWSPQIGLIQGSLNKPCIALPGKVNGGALGGYLGSLAIQDVNVLSSPQNQQCTENSTQAKGDEALSHILDNIPLFSGNGYANN